MVRVSLMDVIIILCGMNGLAVTNATIVIVRSEIFGWRLLLTRVELGNVWMTRQVAVA